MGQKISHSVCKNSKSDVCDLVKESEPTNPPPKYTETIDKYKGNLSQELKDITKLESKKFRKKIKKMIEKELFPSIQDLKDRAKKLYVRYELIHIEENYIWFKNKTVKYKIDECSEGTIKILYKTNLHDDDGEHEIYLLYETIKKVMINNCSKIGITPVSEDDNMYIEWFDKDNHNYIWKWVSGI